MLALAFSIQLIDAEGTIVVDGSLSDWIDLGISPIGLDSDDQWAGYADLLKFWAYLGDENLYLAIQVDWEYPVDSWPVIFTILITPENSSSWYEVIWYNASCTILLGHGEKYGEIRNITSATGWDGVIEFSVPLSFIDNPKVVALEVDSYSSDWMYNIDMMPAPWEEPYKIPEFPSAIILPLFMVLSIIAIVLARKKRKNRGPSSKSPIFVIHHNVLSNPQH
jgi:hypothetical protein